VLSATENRSTTRLIRHAPMVPQAAAERHFFACARVRAREGSFQEPRVQAPNANAHIERWVGSDGASASTGCSSSVAADSSMSSVSMSGTTTSIGRTGHSTSKRPIPRIQ
jgi:hypothetical protein